jgi:hypothetical protein
LQNLLGVRFRGERQFQRVDARHEFQPALRLVKGFKVLVKALFGTRLNAGGEG